MIRSIARRALRLPQTLKARVRDWRDCHNALLRSVPVVEDAFGVRFVVYPWNRPYLVDMLRREHDESQVAATSLLVREGDTAFDVGANMGTYSVLLSRLCGTRGRVFSFEPVPDTFWTLGETLALNRCENVVPFRTALSNRVDHVKMNLFEPQFSAWNTFGMPLMKTSEGKVVAPSRTVDVSTDTLDEFCAGHGIDRVDFLKVDVEGFETAVFEGAEKLLREHRIDTVCFEISQALLRGANAKSVDTFLALERHGYTAYRFSAKTRAFEGPIHDTTEEWINLYASCRDLTQLASQIVPASMTYSLES